MDTKGQLYIQDVLVKKWYLQNIRTVANNFIQHTHALLMQSRLSKYFDVTYVFIDLQIKDLLSA